MPNVNETNIRPEATTNKPNKLAKETKVLEPEVTKQPAPETKKRGRQKKTETTPKKIEKKTRAPKARKVEDLVNEATKKMTDKEKDILIKFLREDANKLQNQIKELKHNIESAYAKANQLEEHYNAMEAFYRENLNYIDGQVIAFANAVRKSTMAGGVH